MAMSKSTEDGLYHPSQFFQLIYSHPSNHTLSSSSSFSPSPSRSPFSSANPPPGACAAALPQPSPASASVPIPVPSPSADRFSDPFPNRTDDARSSPSRLALIPTMVKHKTQPQPSSIPAVSGFSKVASNVARESRKVVKESNKTKVIKETKAGNQKRNAESSNGLNTVNSCRYDSSLGLLTKKFINLIQEAEDGTLDLNNAAYVLEVQKRRIYDITNVLEGIDLIEKTSKNHIRWKGSENSGAKEFGDQVARLKAEVNHLCAEERRLDDLMREKQDALRVLKEDENHRKYLFVTEDDIMTLPCFQNQTLIAIKTPPASYIEVPDPDDDIGFPKRQYKMMIKSSTGPIDAYLLSDYDRQREDVLSAQSDGDQSTFNLRPCGMPEAGFAREYSKSYDTYCSSSLGESKIKRLVIPSDFDVDADYWFESDPAVRLTDLWGN